MIDLKQLGYLDHALLPQGYFRIVELGLTNVNPWHFLSTEECLAMLQELERQYAPVLYFPFARREDNDDVACVIQSHDNPEAITIVHMYASAGWEVDAEYVTFWNWYRNAVEDLIEVEMSQ